MRTTFVTAALNEVAFILSPKLQYHHTGLELEQSFLEVCSQKSVVTPWDAR